MNGGSAVKIRFVRCPKCRNVLLEPQDIPVYKCGVCSTYLRAKIRKSNPEVATSGLHETNAAQKNRSDHITEAKESSISNHEETLLYSGERSSDHPNRMDSAASSDEPRGSGSDRNGSGDFDSKQPRGVNSSHNKKNESDKNDPGESDNQYVVGVRSYNEHQQNGSDQNESEDCVDLKLRGVSLSSDDQERGNYSNETPECDHEQPENFDEVQIQQIESGDGNDEQLGRMGGTSTEARNDWSERNDSSDCNVHQAGFSYKVCSPTKLDEELSPLAAAKPIAEVNEGEIQQNESGAFSNEQLGSVNLSTEAENDGSGQNESENCLDLKLRGVSLPTDDQERGNDPNEYPKCDHEQPDNFYEVQIQQIESGDCNDEQLGGMAGISTEARNDWSERNDSSDCNVHQAGLSYKVCSPTKHDEEVSPLAAAKPKAEVNEGEIQQNESGAFSDKQLGSVNLSTKAQNDGSGQNESEDCVDLKLRGVSLSSDDQERGNDPNESPECDQEQPENFDEVQIQQIESGDCNNEQLRGMGGISTEAGNDWSERNDSSDCSVDQAGFSYKVCSPTKLDEEVSPLAAAKPIAEVNEGEIQQNDSGAFNDEQLGSVNLSTEAENDGSGQIEAEDGVDLQLKEVSLSSDDHERGNDPNESPECDQEQPENFDEVQSQQIESGDCNDKQLGGMEGISTEARNDWSERNDSSDCSVDQAGFSYKVCSPTKLDEEVSPLAAAKPKAAVNEGEIQQNESGAFSDEQLGSVNLSIEAQNDGSGQNESEDCVDLKLRGVNLSSDDQERGNDPNESPECDQEEPENLDEVQIQQIESGDCNDEQLGGMGGISTEARNDSSDCSVDQAGFSYKVCSPTKLDEEVSPLAAAKPIAEVNEGEIQQNESGAFSDEQLGSVNLSTEAENDGSGQNEAEDCVDLQLRGVSLSNDDQERGNDPNESPECDQEQPENFDEVQSQQIDSGDCNDEQFERMGGISTEARNDSSDCSVDQAGFSYEVCSPTKLDEEVSPLAAAKPIAEVNEGGIQQNESGAFSDEQLGSVNLSTKAKNDGSGQNEAEDCVDLQLRGVSLSSDDHERGNDPNESPECDQEQPENFDEVQIQQIESGDCNDEQLGGMGGISTEARNDWSERNDSSDCSVDQAGFSYKVCSPTKLVEEVSPLAAAKPIAEVNEGEIQQNESGAFSDEELGSVNLSTEAENDGSGQNEAEDCVDLKLRGVSLSNDDQERGNDPNESPECDQVQPENFDEVQIQQIESWDCNDEQLGGMGGTSTEARNEWGERNDSSDCSVDQAGFSYKVCSPTKLVEELSLLAAAKPIAEVNEGGIQQNESGAFSDEQLGSVNLSTKAKNDGSGQNEAEDCVDLQLRGVSLSSDDHERGNDPNESPECDQEQPENFDEVQIQQIESGDCNDEQLGGMGGISTEARNDWSERNDSSDCSVDQAGFSYKVCSPTKLVEEVSPLAAAKPIAEVNEGEIQQNESGAFSDEELGSVNLSTEAENDGSGQNEAEDCVDLKLRGVSLSNDDQERGNDPNESPECDQVQPENFDEVQIQQIESWDCNDEQLGGMGGTSTEARNEWGERNDSSDCSVDQAGFSYKVCSPTKLVEELSLLAAAKPIAEVNEGGIQQNESGAFSDEQLGSVNLSTKAKNDGSGQNEAEDCVDLQLRGVSLSSDDHERGNDPNESPECDQEQPENFDEVQIQQIESGDCNDEQLGGMGGISTEARNDWSERNDSSDCSVDQAGFSYKVCSPTKLVEEVSPLAAAKPIAEVNEGEIQQNESGAFSDEELGSVNLSTEAENDGSGQNEAEDCVDLKLRGVSLSNDDQERGNDPNESPECDQVQPENFDEVQIQQIESWDCNDEQLGGMGGTSTEARNEWGERNDSSDCSVDQAGFSYKVCSPTKLVEELSLLAAAKPIAEVNEGGIQQNESGAFSDEELGSVNLSTEAENDGSGQNEAEDCVDLKLRGVSLSNDDQERGNDPNESPECDQVQPENFDEVQIQQIESWDCNDEQLGGMGGTSTEARNEWGERNDSSDCSVDQAGFSYKVCSPTKLVEELSLLAAAKPIAEVNEGGIQQNESGAFSDEELGMVNLSTKAKNDGSGQNDSLYFSIQQAVISCEVCSPTKHAHLKNKEHSPLAGENSIVEVSDESSPLTVAKTEFDANNDSDGTSNDDCSLAKLALHESKELSSVEGGKSEGGASSGSSQLAGAKALLDASKDSDSDFIKSSFEKSVDKEGASVVAAQRPAGESDLSDIFIPSLNEQPEKLHETGRHDVDCVQFTDTFKTIDLIDHSSELSEGLVDLSKSPTTRSSRAYYDDAASSYEGTDDRLPDRPKHPFRNTHKQANHAASNERPRSEKFVANSSLEMQHHLKSHTSIISDKNHRALKFSKLNDDKLVEHTRVVHPARNWRTLEEDFLAGYDKGSPSNLNNNESHSNPYFHSRDKAAYTEQEKMKLLQMIYELQDQVNILHGKEKGRVTPGVTWKDHNPNYHDHLEQVVFDDYPSYPGRFRGGSNWHQQSKYPRIPFSAKEASKRNQVDHLLCCCSQDRCLAQPPPPNLHHNRVFCKANDRVEFYHSYGSCPSTPQRHANSEFPIYRRGTHSDDHRRRDHEVRNYARKKHHLAKRHLLPLAGGAPFITCFSCFKQLQLPADFLLSKRKYHQLRCGVCSEVLRFSLVSRTHLVPYTPSADASPPSAADEHSGVLHMRNSVSSSHASNCPNVDPVSFSEDYGLPFYKSCSTDGDPVQASLRSAERSQTYNSVEYREKRKKIILNERRKNPEETPELSRPSSSMSITKKVSSEIEELPRKGGGGSPLHRLMGYSSPGRLIYGYEPSCSSWPYPEED